MAAVLEMFVLRFIKENKWWSGQTFIKKTLLSPRPRFVHTKEILDVPGQRRILGNHFADANATVSILIMQYSRMTNCTSTFIT